MEGHTTQLAEDGIEAVEAMKEDGFDSIVMDVELPGMNGLEATQQISSLPNGSNIPILVFTGYSQSDYKRKALEAGANDVVFKPIDPQTLLSHVKQIVQH